jgi:hypothetical protein
VWQGGYGKVFLLHHPEDHPEHMFFANEYFVRFRRYEKRGEGSESEADDGGQAAIFSDG